MIEPDLSLGLAIGAFGAKAALGDRAGKILAQEQVGHDWDTPSLDGSSRTCSEPGGRILPGCYGP